MSSQTMQPTQKFLEYQEASLALRAAEKLRRKAITVFSVPLIVAIFGVIFTGIASALTFTYLSFAGLIVVFVSYVLVGRCNKVIKNLRHRLCVLQSEVAAHVYSDSTDIGSWERRFYIFLHLLVGLTFLFIIAYSYEAVLRCNYFPWQACEIFRSECPSLADCPCGMYRSIDTSIVNACMNHDPSCTPPPTEGFLKKDG